MIWSGPSSGPGASDVRRPQADQRRLKDTEQLLEVNWKKRPVSYREACYLCAKDLARIGSIRSNFGKQDDSARNGLETGQGGSGGSTCVFGGPSQCWPASRNRHATAVIRAAPFPLPSSDWRKDTSHLGESCFTVSCITLEKLQKEQKGTGGHFTFFILPPHPPIGPFFCFHFSFLALQQKCQRSSVFNCFYKLFLGRL